MKFGKTPDILLNLVLPLSLGFFIYWAGKTVFIPAPVRNYLPDSLWAYAFISSILIIWDREIPVTWIVLVFLFAAGFEGLQYVRQIPGTGDVYDIVTYFLSFIIALRFNKFFKKVRFDAKPNSLSQPIS